MPDVGHTETSIVLLSYRKDLWIIHSKYSWISYEFKLFFFLKGLIEIFGFKGKNHQYFKMHILVLHFDE